ncbi:anthranilate synthase component 1, partial [Arsukibacterium sp.]|uniref:anthranilate synthase component 1 n=1 Tax=Arsukibacterium sp. TaxID=1977258 RepID=UPI002FDB80E5
MIFSHITDTPGEVASIAMSLPYQANALACYQSLTAQSPCSLLLESAEIDSKDNLKSLLLIDAALRIVCKDQSVEITAISSNGQALLPYLAELLTAEAVVSQHQQHLSVTYQRPPLLLEEQARLNAANPFSVLRTIQQQLRCHSNEPFAVMLGGVIGYDMVATVEQLPEVPMAENQCPDYVFYLAETLLVLDHQRQQSRVIGNVFCGEQAAANCFVIGKRLEQLKQLLQAEPTAQQRVTVDAELLQARVDISDADFVQQVEKLKHNIVAGDVFQVVPSRCFQLPCPDPLAAYGRLKQQNPSPYMFYLKDSDFILFGASPESALKFDAKSRQVEIYPIAGTRRRGFNADGSIDRDLDSRIELELRQDEKEKAEHLMLVDLARNDVARISVPGSRYVKELLKVDRYSYVMHLVSKVVGT